MKTNYNSKLMLTDTNKGISVFFYPTDYTISSDFGGAECDITGKLNMGMLSEEKRKDLLELLGL